jgi:predicted 3-demethylubiquinone-9 3-methyltransferase (glyoxalase superfamily)
MTAKPVQKITPHLWYAKEAEEAARFYASIFPDSHVDRVTALPSDSPGGPAGSVKLVELTLSGQAFLAISAGPLDPFNHAISFVVNCDDQAEVDRYWDALRKRRSTRAVRLAQGQVRRVLADRTDRPRPDDNRSGS